VEASRLPKTCRSVVCVHRCEEAAELLRHIQWENVDMLVTVGSSFVEQIVLRLVPDIHHRTRVVNISQGVDLDRFRFVGRPRGKNLVCMDRLDARNNQMFLLQCMQKLHYIDSGYKLFFAGGFHQVVLEQYLRHITDALELKDVVFFCAQQGDLECWLQDKHYVVSADTGGGQGTEVLEAMAYGLKPVVHNFPSAGEIFQPEFIFNISEQFCEQILSDRYEPARYRKFVEERYPLKRQLEKVNEIFVQLEAEIDLRRAGGAHNDCGGRAAGIPEQC
jgi:glycosyltransferase involved in cell wall biosynthesis